MFKSGERVRITAADEPRKVYKIKKIKATRNGILYLLKSLEKDSTLRMYYEDKKLLLERIR